MNSDDQQHNIPFTTSASAAISKALTEFSEKHTAISASGAILKAIDRITKVNPAISSSIEMRKAIEEIAKNNYAFTPSSEIFKTVDTLSKAIGVTSYTPLFNTIDRISRDNLKVKGLLSQTPKFYSNSILDHLANDQRVFWTEQFIQKMTQFKRVTDVLGKHQQDYVDYLYATNQRHRLNTVTGIESATVASLRNLEFLRYDLINEPIAEIPSSNVILLDETSKVKKAIWDIYKDNEIVFKLEPRNFEELVAELLRKKGFDVQLTKQTRDGGYDLIALNNIGGFPYRFLVECKRFAQNRKVDVNIIRSFCQVMNTNNSNGIIVTSSRFSPDAKKYRKAYAPHLLHFKDNGDIIDWVNEYVI